VKNKQSLSAWSRAVHSSNTEQDRRVQNQDQSSDVGETTKQHDPVFEIQSDGYWNRKSGQNNRHVNAIVSGSGGLCCNLPGLYSRPFIRGDHRLNLPKASFGSLCKSAQFMCNCEQPLQRLSARLTAMRIHTLIASSLIVNELMSLPADYVGQVQISTNTTDTFDV